MELEDFVTSATLSSQLLKYNVRFHCTSLSLLTQSRSVYDLNKPVQQNTKLEQLGTATRNIPTEGEGSIHRTTFGAKADNVELTMKAGRRGPTLLSDPVFRDKISHFDHERIPGELKKGVMV